MGGTIWSMVFSASTFPALHGLTEGPEAERGPARQLGEHLTQGLDGLHELGLLIERLAGRGAHAAGAIKDDGDGPARRAKLLVQLLGGAHRDSGPHRQRMLGDDGMRLRIELQAGDLAKAMAAPDARAP